MRLHSFLVSLLSVLLVAPSAAGQQLSELIQDGRFEEAAAFLTSSGQPPSAVEAGARQIWERAYRAGYQRDDYATRYAVSKPPAGSRASVLKHAR